MLACGCAGKKRKEKRKGKKSASHGAQATCPLYPDCPPYPLNNLLQILRMSRRRSLRFVVGLAIRKAARVFCYLDPCGICKLEQTVNTSFVKTTSVKTTSVCPPPFPFCLFSLCPSPLPLSVFLSLLSALCSPRNPPDWSRGTRTPRIRRWAMQHTAIMARLRRGSDASR